MSIIRTYVGNVGSGKTISSVMDMCLNPDKNYLTNIRTKHLKNNTILKSTDIFRKELVKTKKDGTPVFRLALNEQFWRDWVKENPCTHIIIDEAQRFMNSRRSSSSPNIVMADFLALIRRIVGDSSTYQGSLTLISQLDYRIDIIARDMSTQCVWHICHYMKRCKHCGLAWSEDSEQPEPLWECPRCGSVKVEKYGHWIERRFYQNVQYYMMSKWRGVKSWYRREKVNNISRFFGAYDTLQWDELMGNMY